MQKENLTIHQAQSVLVMFFLGTSVVEGVYAGAGQDSWISLLLGAAFALPIMLMYARIMKLYPQQDLYDIMETLFGRVGGKVFAALMAWWALHLCALVLRNFSEYIQITSLPNTPQLAFMILLFFVTVYLARSGIRILGKWSFAVLPVLLILFTLTIILSLNRMDFTNILPILSQSPDKIAKGALQIIGFPFGESVVFLCVAKGIKKEDSPYQVILIAFLFSTFIMLLIILHNIFILGGALMQIELFPSFVAAGLIQIGDFLGRIEGTITLNFLLAGIAKGTLSLIAASRGIAKVAGIKNHKTLMVPVGLLVLALWAVVFKSWYEMTGFLKYYKFYLIPFYLIIPMVVWIAAEIRVHKKTDAAKIALKADAGD